MLAHYSVHTPIEAKPDDIAYYETKRGKHGKERFITRDGTTKAEQDNATYAAMIKSVDDSLQQILDTLDTLNLRDDTLILLTSDHGGLSNRGADSGRNLATSNLPLRAGKGHLYEGGIRVPFIVSWPNITKDGSTSDAIVTGSDVYATLLEAANLPLQPSDHIDSVSILPAIKGAPFKRGPILWHSPRPRPSSTGDTAATALRDGDYKIIKFYFPTVHYELYNLIKDPSENNDLSQIETDMCNELITQLEKMLKATNAIEVIEN